MRSSWLKRRRGSLRRQEGATMEKKGGNLRPYGSVRVRGSPLEPVGTEPRRGGWVALFRHVVRPAVGSAVRSAIS